MDRAAEIVKLEKLLQELNDKNAEILKQLELLWPKNTTIAFIRNKGAGFQKTPSTGRVVGYHGCPGALNVQTLTSSCVVPFACVLQNAALINLPRKY